ncbi:MAG: PAS domain-containing protein [Hyphomonadaceae bacterium]|nr:PAS domain-containing protein [Hyphomonadaceae bacterium]
MDTEEFARAAQGAGKAQPELEGHLRHVLDALPAMTFVLDAQGILIEANAAALKAANLAPTAVIGAPLAETYWWSWSEEAQARLKNAASAARREGGAQRYQEKIRVGEERFLTVIAQVAPMRGGGGQVTHLAVSAIDVSELVEMQERQALLSAELTHRVKNILAIVQALVSRSAKRAPSKEALVASLNGRIAAMAASISQLSLSQWTGYDLRGVLVEQLGALGSDRITIEGPEVQLSPKAAMAFALIAYELGTNAAKHGALSNPDGRVSVRWQIANGDFAFDWREAGGPAVTAPSELGFGSTLVRNLAEGDLGANATVEYAREGLTAHFRGPASRLAEAAHARAGIEANGGPKLAGKRIVIVEESPVVALDLANLLEGEGARVLGTYVVTEEARAAFADALNASCDILILNAEMDGGARWPLAETARAGGAKLLFSTTGESTSALTRRFPEAQVLVKPYPESDLLRALARLAA